MKRLNKIYKVDLDSMTVNVGAGIIMEHLEWELKKDGLSTMHDAASSYCATLGGFLVTEEREFFN